MGGKEQGRKSNQTGKRVIKKRRYKGGVIKKERKVKFKKRETRSREE